MSVRPLRLASAAAVIAALALAGCAGNESNESDAGDQIGGTLTVYAAASLTGAFDELAVQFESQYPGLDVLPISYDGSSVLATQLIAGAPADVFASADESNMSKVVDAALASDPAIFATNVLQIAVAPGNPLAIEDLRDLADPDLTVVVCAAEVPCGTASTTLLDAAGVTIVPASEEQNVTAVLAKVKSGEADAGLVYRTDVSSADGAVVGVPIEGADQATNMYPLVALKDNSNVQAAGAFVDFVLSDAGQKVLADFGFGEP